MRKSYIQIAFNGSLSDFTKIIPHIPLRDHVIIEAGTPFIKREGIKVINTMRRYWSGAICADLKIVDGAKEEVAMAAQAGATSVTALGSAPTSSLKVFIEACKQNNVQSIIDMLGNSNPMRTLWKSGITPDTVFVHRGRDEENVYGTIIQYKDIAKIKGKWNIDVGAAGGMDKKELQSAIFNNADIVVVNVVNPGDGLKGIAYDQSFKQSLKEFLLFVE